MKFALKKSIIINDGVRINLYSLDRSQQEKKRFAENFYLVTNPL